MAIGNLRRITDLAKSRNQQELVDHHRYVIQFYEDRNTVRRRAYNFVRGQQHSPDELEQYRIKRKAPLVFNQLKASERTILGMFLQNKYDVKFVAVEPGDQDMADVLEQLRIWESNRNDDLNIDLNTVREAWAGGTAYQECYVDTKPGKDPVIRTDNLNPFAVYFDPNSRDLISRKDAQFVDVDSWMSEEDMVETWSESAEFIRGGLRAYSPNANGYESVNKSVDRDHESRLERNGQYRVTERYFRLNKKTFFYLNEKEGHKVKIEKDDVDAYKQDFPGHEVQADNMEELWLAVACEAIVQGMNDGNLANNNPIGEDDDHGSSNGIQYLYLGKYHAQPIDPADNKIIWPILEMCAEQLNGEPQGFVEQMFDPQRVMNSTISNKVHSAKHAASQSKLIDYSAFKDEKEAVAASKYSSDADRSFQVKPGRLGDAIQPIEHRRVTPDNDESYGAAQEFISTVSSTPPALQGQSEESNTSGVLNAQRIEQSHVQLQVLIKNFRQFLKYKNMLRYAYWREFYKEEMVFRIIEPTPEMRDNGTDFMAINQKVPAQDPYGYEVPGVVEVLNDINALTYDIVVEESSKSSTYRYKTQSQLAEMMQSAAVQQDPVLHAMLFQEWAMLSDVNNKLKDGIREHSSVLTQYTQQQQQMEQQAAQQQQQQGDLAQQQQVQQMAQTEAEQTAYAQPQLAPDQAMNEPQLTPEQIQMMLEGG
tara:strand:+ start:2513 stop:4633 length:2121 start_codon:yes stop_codon:yes gene_type:complete